MHTFSQFLSFLIVSIGSTLSSEYFVIATPKDDVSLTNVLFKDFHLPTSELEGSYKTICSEQENNGRNLASGYYINVFSRCMRNGSVIHVNCPEDTYFLEFVEECVFIPCGVSFDNKILSAIDDGRTRAKPCRPCKNSCYGDVYDGDRCDPPKTTTPKPPADKRPSSTVAVSTTESFRPSQPSTPPTTTPNPLYECPMGVDYPVNIAHPCGCRKYQICQRGRKSIAFCRKGLVYDIARRMCNRESDVQCPNVPNCDNDLVFEDQIDRSNDSELYELFDLIRSLSDNNDNKSNDVEPYGLFNATNIRIKNINFNIIKPHTNDDTFAISSPQRDDCVSISYRLRCNLDRFYPNLTDFVS